MVLQLREEQGFKYVEEGKGKILLLLHGLFGALSNWKDVLSQFSSQYRVIIPIIPIYEMPVKKAGIGGLTEYVTKFIQAKNLDTFTLIGNSLGGHLALYYTLNYPDKVERLVLTGSSGLYENTLGGSIPRRRDYAYVADRVAHTFYDPNTATKAYVDEVFNVTTNIPKALRVVATAKSAQRNNLADDLPRIQKPTLLIWGLNDTITPPAVGHEFNALMPNSSLRFIDQCCHAPMMERPQKFNDIVAKFLEDTTLN